MKKCYVLFLIIVLNSAFAVPDVDDSAVLGNDATCDETSLDITDLSADLHAEWEPNTINLKYYTDGTQYGDGYSCSYDGFVEIPPQPQDKHGYDFVGWQVRCNLSAYTPSTNGTNYGYISGNGIYSANASLYNLTDFNTWAVQFDTGLLTGIALCREVSVNIPYDPSVKPGVLVHETGCSCAATSFGDSCNVSSSPLWVSVFSGSLSSSEKEKLGNNIFVDDEYVFAGSEGTFSCIDDCAEMCANRVKTSSGFRTWIFGGKQ